MPDFFIIVFVLPAMLMPGWLTGSLNAEPYAEGVFANAELWRGSVLCLFWRGRVTALYVCFCIEPVLREP